jgi:hypothetical protein
MVYFIVFLSLYTYREFLKMDLISIVKNTLNCKDGNLKAN